MYHRLKFSLFLLSIFVLISIKNTSSSSLSPQPEDSFAPRLLWSSDKSHPLTEFGKIHIINRKPEEKGWGWEGDGYGWGHHDDHHHHHEPETYHINVGWKKAEKKKGKGLLKGWLKIPEQKFGIHVKGGVGFSLGKKKEEEEDKGWVKPTTGWGWGSYHHGWDKGWDKGWGWKPKGWGWQPKGWGWEPKGWGWVKPKGWGWGGWERSGVQAVSDDAVKTKVEEKLDDEDADEGDDDAVDEKDEDDTIDEKDEDDKDEDDAVDDKEDEEEAPSDRSLLLVSRDEGIEINLNEDEDDLPNERTLVLVNDEVYDDDRIPSEDFSYYYAPELPYY